MTKPSKQTEPRVSKITIGRLFNLGSYEHVRYELTVEIPSGQSAEKTLIGLEKIVEAIAPEKHHCVHTEQELKREKFRIEELGKELLTLSEGDFRSKHGFFVGTPAEYADRCSRSYFENVAKRKAYVEKERKARAMLDRLGGTEEFKDAKLDWENDYQP